jgi:hypothetical protein
MPLVASASSGNGSSYGSSSSSSSSTCYAAPRVCGGGAYACARSHAMGQIAEQRFLDLCQAHRMPFRCATPRENIINHFDVVVQVPSATRPLRIEVKAMKARHRGAPPDPRVIYAELRAVRNNPGWLYGDADAIAFEQEHGFLLVHRGDLVQHVHRLLPTCPQVHRSGIPHTLYTRAGRQDLVMVLDRDRDLAALRHTFIESAEVAAQTRYGRGTNVCMWPPPRAPPP